MPENISCFQISAGEGQRFGRGGATEIRVLDIDRMLNFKWVCGRIYVRDKCYCCGTAVTILLSHSF